MNRDESLLVCLKLECAFISVLQQCIGSLIDWQACSNFWENVGRSCTPCLSPGVLLDFLVACWHFRSHFLFVHRRKKPVQNSWTPRAQTSWEKKHKLGGWNTYRETTWVATLPKMESITSFPSQACWGLRCPRTSSQCDVHFYHS